MVPPFLEIWVVPNRYWVQPDVGKSYINIECMLAF